jgi:hypothetical protein
MRAFLLLALLPMAVWAKTINIVPGDSYTKMEAAVAGDEVVIAPGSYAFRVDWENAGTSALPITVRAQDPNNRPVWDLTGIPVGTAPGSYTAGDKHRGCWQFRGGYYRVDGIVFKNCQDDSSAGLRVVNVPSIEVRHCLFQGNTNGMTGAGDGIVIENSEFDGNGLPQTPAAHQIYIFGGTLQVRGSYFHDSPAGQNFHVRARDATLEYNWFAPAGSYGGDIMSCEFFCGGTGTNPIQQKMLLRGNVIVQGTPANHGQMIALYKDGGDSSDGTGTVGSMDITLIYNTIIGTSGYNNDVVHHLNDSGISTAAHLSNNVIVNVKTVNLIEAPATMNFTVDGNANWVTTGTDASRLTGTLSGADPLLDAGRVPQSGSPLIGKAQSLGAQNPTSQYLPTASTQARGSANDIGAYESGTATVLADMSVTPGADLSVLPDLSGDVDLAGVDLAGVDSTPDLSGNASAKSGCGCQLGSGTPPNLSGGWIAFYLLCNLFYLQRRRRSKRW